MSTVRKPKGRTKSTRLKRDPFFYGWRDIYRKDRNGREVHLQIPLTEEDVLHPRVGDHIVNSDLHWDDVRYLYDVIKTHLAAITTALVLADVGVYWGVRSPHHHSPDVTVIFGVRARDHWPSFHVKKEGVRPEMIIEVTSPSTRNVDLRKKRIQYYQVGVPYYFIADEQYRQRKRTLRLIGYRRGLRGFERLPLSQQGRLWLEPVGLWLGQEDGRVACYDEQDNRLGDYAEVERAWKKAEREREEEAHARVEAERARAAAEERVRQLEAELRRSRGNHS